MTSNNFKNDIVNRMGGTTQYEMTVLDFCERIRSHKKLFKYYEGMDINSLFLFQKETFDWAFGDYATSDEESKAKNRVKLRHYRVLKNGLSDRHFDAICQQFVEAMRESWVEEDVINEATENLQCLHSLLRSMKPSKEKIWFHLEGSDEESASSMFSVDTAELANIPSSPKDSPVQKEKDLSSTGKSSTMYNVTSLFHNLTPRAA